MNYVVCVDYQAAWRTSIHNYELPIIN